MNKNQSKFVIVVIVMLLVFLLFASVFLSSHSPVGTVYPSVDLNLDNVTVWCIGNYNGVGSVLVPMQQLGAQTKILDMELSNYTVLDFNSYSVILFDSDWLCKQ
jgi:hypothetical protein